MSDAWIRVINTANHNQDDHFSAIITAEKKKVNTERSKETQDSDSSLNIY